jgi:hypothetical protein
VHGIPRPNKTPAMEGRPQHGDAWRRRHCQTETDEPMAIT